MKQDEDCGRGKRGELLKLRSLEEKAYETGSLISEKTVLLGCCLWHGHRESGSGNLRETANWLQLLQLDRISAA